MVISVMLLKRCVMVRWMNELAKKVPINVKWDVFEAVIGEGKAKAK